MQSPIQQNHITKEFRYRAWTPLGLIGVLLSLSGCLSPIALHQAVLSYDRVVNEIGAEELLLNIARIRRHHPVHFTAVSSVAATFNFQVNAGATPPLGALESKGLSPIFGGSMSENPTITIIPVEGEEFNQRVLTPMTEDKFLKLYQQGADLGLLLRMMASELRADHKGPERILRNRPRRAGEYEEFRRRTLHLTALYQAHQLFVEPIVVQQLITLPANNAEHAGVVVDALEKGYRWAEEGATGVLSRKVVGRVVMSNYDLSSLTSEERKKLYLHTNTLPDNEIFIDIRPGFPGGDYPYRGTVQLRGFLGILGSLARGIVEEAEYHVDPDARTGAVRLNPAKTMEVTESTGRPSDAAFSVSYGGLTYSVVNGESPAAVWNLEAFRLLNQLYELSVHPSEFGRPAPAITIAK